MRESHRERGGVEERGKGERERDLRAGKREKLDTRERGRETDRQQDRDRDWRGRERERETGEVKHSKF